MPVTYRLINNNEYAGVRLYPGCHYDVVPYLQKNHEIYTGLTDNKKRKELEDKLQMPDGLGWRSPFWETFFIRFTDEDLILRPEESAKDLLWDLFLSQHKDCKRNTTDVKAKALFVRVDEQEEAVKVVEKGQIKQEAMAYLQGMNLQEKKDCLRIFGINGDIVSDNIVAARLFQIVDDNPKKFKLVWMDSRTRNTEAFLKRCIDLGVIARKGRGHFFNEVNIGNSEADVVNYLDDKKNSQEVLGMQKMVDERKKNL